MPGMDHVLSKAFLATGGSVAYPQWSLVQQVAGVGLTPAAVQLAPTTAGTATTPGDPQQKAADATTPRIVPRVENC